MQSKDYQKLLNCPFCGGEAAMQAPNMHRKTCVVCKECGVSTGWGTVDTITSAWNRRAQPDNEPLVTCGECAKYQTPDCAAKHEQALLDSCSHGVRKLGGEQDA